MNLRKWKTVREYHWYAQGRLEQMDKDNISLKDKLAELKKQLLDKSFVSGNVRCIEISVANEICKEVLGL